MKRFSRFLIPLILMGITLIIAGCGDDHDHDNNVVFSISTASLPGATIGAAYNQTLTASGGTAPLTWSISTGTLPAGLTLNTSTGVISGTPTTAGTSNFTAMVTDSSNPAQSATKALSITVSAPAALTITTASLPGGTVGTAYSQTLAATGGTGAYSWSVSVGTLPAGLTLTPATGVISGTPSAVETANFTVMVTDSATPTAATATRALSIAVVAAGTPITITTTSPLAAATFGTAYSQTLAATGGSGAYTWAVTAGTLPAGLSLNTSTGVISGTPTAPAVPNPTTSNFTIGVTGAVSGSATKPFAITASLSASAAAGRTIYDANCSGCHQLGIYDTTGGSPNLAASILTVPTLTTALNARFGGGATHNGQALTATQITNVLDFFSLY